MLKQIWHGFTDLVYPPQCHICLKFLKNRFPTEALCLACQADIAQNIPPFCTTCSRHLPAKYFYGKCKNCLKQQFYFDFVWSACLYQKGIKTILHDFKYHQKIYLRHYCSQLMCHFIIKNNLDINQFDLIIPIPLHPTRLRERGYNQSQLLAQLISKKFTIPISHKILKRQRFTTPQNKLTQKERWTNVQGAFKISRPKSLENKNILLVDDLLTTGATTSEAAKILKENGAQTIGVLTTAIAL